MLAEEMSSNFSQNGTLRSSLQAISRPAVIFMRCQGTVIFLVNLIVLIILINKKSKLPVVYWLQIVCLTLNDVLAGLANFLISFIDYPYFKENVTNCSIVIVFLFSSQSASLYNIFGICIHRFVAIKMFHASPSVWKHQHTLLCTSLAWILSICLCSLPAVLYQKPDGYNKIKVCSVQSIFGSDVNKGMLILVGSFIIPLIFTNVLYIILFCLLKYMWKAVRPCHTSTSSDVNSFCPVSALSNGSNNAPRNRTTMLTTLSGQSGFSEGISVETDISQFHGRTKTSQSREGKNRPKSFERTEENAQITLQNKQTTVFIQVQKRQKTVELLSVKSLCEPTPSTSEEQFHSTPNNLHKTHSNDTSPTYSLSSFKPLNQCRQNVPQTLLRQRRAYTFVGIILLFLNIFSWPGVAALVLTSMIDIIPLGRDTLLPLFTTICVNSAVNPILYTVTISEFRCALFDILLGVYKILKW